MGGFPALVRNFLPDRPITVADAEGGAEKNFCLADGSRLPFADGAFGMVVSLDVLEHVAPEKRADFVAEACRVAANHVVIAAPFASDGVRAADRAIHEYVYELSGAPQRFLAEHVDTEPPDLVNTMAWMLDAGLDVQVLPSGRLDRWMMMMALYYALDADADLRATLPFLMEAYNRSFYEFDKAEPAYRHFLVGAREGLGRRWGKLADLASGEAREGADTRPLALIVEFGRVLALREKNAEIERLRSELERRDAELAAVRKDARKLEDFMTRTKSLPLYSIYEKFIKPVKNK